MKLIPAKDWVAVAPLGRCSEETFVKAIQANALGAFVDVIQEAVDAELPLDSAIAMMRIKAGNLTDGKQITKRNL